MNAIQLLCNFTSRQGVTDGGRLIIFSNKITACESIVWWKAYIHM